MHKGRLRVCVIDDCNSKPIGNAKVIIKNHGAEENTKLYSSKSREYSAITNNLGYTRTLELETLTQENQKSISENKPFSVWDIWIKASGFRTCVIRGVEVFSGVISLESCKLIALSTKESNIDIINVLPNAVFEKYPPKIPELVEKIENDDLKKIYIQSLMAMPMSLVVHDGLPEDDTASNYTIELKEYIKNVACSSMYPTWNDNSLRAGVLSIISFTFNRIFTQHYRKKGKNYDITSSTAYDQLFSYNRSIHLNISRIVDEVYPVYIVKSGQITPFFIQCCDGIRNEYPGWFSYWKSNILGQQGMTSKGIIKSLIGEDIEIYNINSIMGADELNIYRSFVPPMPPYSGKGIRPKVSYPDDV